MTCLLRISEAWISYTSPPPPLPSWELRLPWDLQQQVHKQLPEPVYDCRLQLS